MRFRIFFGCWFLFLPLLLRAHNINYALEGAGAAQVWTYYFWLGLTHIIPFGLDHILFVVGLCLLADSWRALLWQATAFTVAHSVTLALSLTGKVELPAEVVEPAIALSILFIAVENMLVKRVHPWRIALVFLFGLMHGLGFAGVLSEIGLPPGRLLPSLIAFNIGVEAGQIFIILFVYGLIVRRFGGKNWYRLRFFIPISVAIGLISLYWFIDRL